MREDAALTCVQLRFFEGFQGLWSLADGCVKLPACFVRERTMQLAVPGQGTGLQFAVFELRKLLFEQ